MSQTITQAERATGMAEVLDWLDYHRTSGHEDEASCEECELTLFMLAEIDRVKQEALAQGWDEGTTAVFNAMHDHGFAEMCGKDHDAGCVKTFNNIVNPHRNA
jgi:hypothetical protein